MRRGVVIVSPVCRFVEKKKPLPNVAKILIETDVFLWKNILGSLILIQHWLGPLRHKGLRRPCL